VSKVLIVTRSTDNESVEHVSRALEELGAEPIRLNSDLYPTRVKLSASYVNGRRRRQLITEDGRRHDLDALTSVYYRRFSVGREFPDDLGDTRYACTEESKLTLLGTIAALDCFQLDPVSIIRLCDYKELQQKTAEDCGLDCPGTLFTNDPDAALRFFSQTPAVVTKMQAQFAIYREGQENVVFTNRVRPDDLDSLHGLRYSPMMFQEQVSASVELRVTVVGKRVFAAAIDPGLPTAEVDWRRDGYNLMQSWTPYELPDDVRRALLRYTERYGLNYAAADFMVTPEGRHLFLEANAAGEWYWLQLYPPHYPIARALAEVLTGKAERVREPGPRKRFRVS